MGKEGPNYMPNEKGIEPTEFHPINEVDFDPEKVAIHASRRFCEPSESIYKNSPDLLNDPIKAIESVDWHGFPLSEINDPVEGLVVASAKLKVAEKELHLSPKEKEVYSGFRENIDGAIGFLGTLRSKVESKVIRSIASGATIVGMALGAAGCGNVIGSYVEITPTTSPVTETIPIDSPTETVPPLPTPGISATETAPQFEVAAYPTSSENFTKIPSISGAEAERRINELGVGEDLTAMKDWYRENGIADSNMLPVLYEQGGEVHWNLAAKSTSGNFLKFTITSGTEVDQVVRAMGMVAYLNSQPTFKTSELKTPAELSGTTQEMTWDKSGWNVVGTFRDGGYSGWYNADQNMWIVENVPMVEPTKAAENEPIHSSLEIVGDVDGVPVTTIFAIGQDISEREEIPLDKWVINPKAEEMLSPGTTQDMIAKVILEAHYHGWQSDDYSGRKSVTFDEYVQKLKNGEDMGYEIAAAVLGSFLDTTIKKVDPLKPVTFVLVNKPGGYGGGSARDVSIFNYVEDDGSLRINFFASLNLMKTDLGVDFTRDDQLYSVETMSLLTSSLSMLSFDVEHQIPTVDVFDYNTYTGKIYIERPELNSGPVFFVNPECNEYEKCVTPLLVTRK